MNEIKPWLHNNWVEQTRIILDSFHHWLGRQLIERGATLQEDARRLYEAPFVVVSHGTQADPIFNYGNQTALTLWELTTEQLLSMPSRLSAEPMHRDERAQLLKRTSEKGYADDYQGIRVSRTGKRFHIREAIIWNLIDESGNRRGQAATFAHWEMIEPVGPAKI